MTIGRPFHRFHHIAAMLAIAMALPKGFERDNALRSVPTYRSRGKGRKKGGGYMSSSNPSVNHNSGPYHRGGREMTRRLGQKQFQNWLADQNNRAAAIG